ncbi:MAG: inositol monophosphatase family protein [Rhizobiaceae bacterium]|nr:inositol monophosphatase family protein [Rhizobiaceae bacterium]
MAVADNSREQFAVELARRAGELGLRYFRDLESLTIESKGHQDLVSEADRDVETFIRAALRDAYPNDGVVGEEHAPTRGKSGFDWVIDPIDGTANFVRGIPAWTVVIAGTMHGVTELGVIHEPSTGETFHGSRGGGAFLNGRPMRTCGLSSLGEGSVGTGFSNRREARNIVPFIDDLVRQGGVFYRNASGALMLAYVASGRLLAYVEEHMNAWDCLAGLLLVEEAGGKIVAPDPATVLADGTVVIAGCAGVFDRVKEMCDAAFRP